MPLTEPTIDDRSYQQILEEALARIPVHNPEWTNFNDSDPGVTVIQLFAFMSESLLYRANRVPERNRIKFLRLLGIPTQPASSARGLVTFSNLRGPLEVKTLPEGVALLAGQVPFRTQDGLDLLPVEAQVYYKGRPAFSAEEEEEAKALYRQLYASYDAPGVDLDLYETKPLEPPVSAAALTSVDLEEDTVDGSLWIALLARTPEEVEPTRKVIANRVLTLGIVPSLTEAARVLPPGGETTDASQPGLVYELPRVDPADEAPVARYAAVEARPSGNVLAEPGVVELALPGVPGLQLWSGLDPLEPGVGDFPPSLDDTAVQERVVTWIRVRPGDAAAAGGRVRARFSYVGINAARVTQRARVFSEFLGEGTGEPDQTVTLVNTPVIPDSVQLTVSGEPWTQVDDLSAAAPEVPRRSPRLSPGVTTDATALEDTRAYTLDRASGQVRFGNGLHGTRPPRGALIQASYDYGGGRQGMVGIGALTKGPLLPSGVKVSNPIPTWGGDEAEAAEEAERRIPAYLQHRDRLVTQADFEEITRRTPGVEIGRVDVLPLFHPDLPDVAAEGVVTVLVIPKTDPVHPNAPSPDRLFLDTVCRYLDPRRLITTEVHVRGPEYVDVAVSVGIDVIPGHDLAPVREAVREAIRAFLSPLEGGFDGAGWALSHDVDALELAAVATRVPGVSRVNELLLGGASGPERPTVPISGLQLPRLTALSVQSGAPLPLARLRGDAGEAGDGAARPRVPVPVVPLEC